MSPGSPPVDNTLFVSTRVRGGKIAMLEYPDHRPTRALGDVLMTALLAAREAGPCPHVKSVGGWVVPVAAGRVMCVECAFSRSVKRRWERGAHCALCGGRDAVFAAYDFWPDGEVVGVTRMIFGLCPACVRSETGAEVRP